MRCYRDRPRPMTNYDGALRWVNDSRTAKAAGDIEKARHCLMQAKSLATQSNSEQAPMLRQRIARALEELKAVAT